MARHIASRNVVGIILSNIHAACLDADEVAKLDVENCGDGLVAMPLQRVALDFSIRYLNSSADESTTSSEPEQGPPGAQFRV